MNKRLKKELLEDIFNEFFEGEFNGNVKSILQISYTINEFNREGEVPFDKIGEDLHTNYFNLYDKNGNKIEANLYNENNVQISKSVYKYCKKGFRVSEDYYNYLDDSKNRTTYKHQFDKVGNVIKLRVYDNKNNLYQSHSFNYNEKKNITEIKTYVNGELLDNAVHNYKGDNIVEVKGYFQNINGKEEYKYIINKENNITEKTFFNYKKDIENILILKYDEKGNTIERKSIIYPSKKTDWEFLDEYELDHKNNWVKNSVYRLEDDLKILYSVIERKIIYYNKP